MPKRFVKIHFVLIFQKIFLFKYKRYLKVYLLTSCAFEKMHLNLQNNFIWEIMRYQAYSQKSLANKRQFPHRRFCKNLDEKGSFVLQYDLARGKGCKGEIVHMEKGLVYTIFVFMFQEFLISLDYIGRKYGFKQSISAGTIFIRNNLIINCRNLLCIFLCFNKYEHILCMRSS